MARKTGSFTYGADGRLSTITHPDATTIEYAYDTRGNLLSIQDERHSEPNTIYAYDALNRLESVTRKRTLVPGTDVVTLYDCDAQDNLTGVTDPNGNTTTYAYDDFGRLQKQTSPVTGVTSYSYDAAGNLLTTTDANSAITTRTYHDANGNRTSIGYPSASVVTYAFDFANRPFSAASGATTLVSSASYLPFGPLRALAFGNGTNQTFTHDARYLPLTQQVLAGATPLASCT